MFDEGIHGARVFSPSTIPCSFQSMGGKTGTYLESQNGSRLDAAFFNLPPFFISAYRDFTICIHPRRSGWIMIEYLFYTTNIGQDRVAEQHIEIYASEPISLSYCNSWIGSEKRCKKVGCPQILTFPPSALSPTAGVTGRRMHTSPSARKGRNLSNSPDHGGVE